MLHVQRRVCLARKAEGGDGMDELLRRESEFDARLFEVGRRDELHSVCTRRVEPIHPVVVRLVLHESHVDFTEAFAKTANAYSAP